MATLTVQDSSESGITPTFNSAAGGGDQFANNGKVFLYLKNTDASPSTVTVTAQQTSYTKDGFGALTKANAEVIVPATTGEKILGPFPMDAFNNSSGNCLITYTSVTALTVAVIRIP
jgi:hypothetical protein